MQFSLYNDKKKNASLQQIDCTTINKVVRIVATLKDIECESQVDRELISLVRIKIESIIKLLILNNNVVLKNADRLIIEKEVMFSGEATFSDKLSLNQ